MDTALFSLASVLWQKKYDKMPDPGESCSQLDSSSTRAIIIIVLPLPGSPLIHSSWVSSQSLQLRKSSSLRIQAQESLRRSSLLDSILTLSSRGSVIPL